MSETMQVCPECGVAWHGGKTCQDDFHQMLYWEAENPSLWEVHHLMVLCYHLQHPTLYSPDGLAWAKETLVEFVEHEVTTEEVRRRNRTNLDSGNRKWKIKGTPDSHGSYAPPVQWTMTATDVTAGAMSDYCDNVRVWAQSVLDAMKASSNL
ncbi:MAG: DUF5946 family protein [Chloroflexia bacterium]